MHHFLFEFITGGGLTGQPLPESLIHEGELMVQTLLNELEDAGHKDILLTRDSRLGLYDKSVEQIFLGSTFKDDLPKLVKRSDVCWLIAPETDGCLESLATLFTEHGKSYIGSSPDAIKIASSKILTNNTLSKVDIKSVETRLSSDKPPESQTGWIIKPDDGVGGEGCLFIKNKIRLSELLLDKQNKNFVVQPYIEGQHMSMSLLVHEDDVQLLACNKQYVNIDDEAVSLEAIGVNECLMFKNEMMMLAKNIVSNISGFAGYIGVDLIESKNELYVLDINPRFTTAYAGISESLGYNITAEILNTFLNRKLPDINLTGAAPVRVEIK